MKKILFNLLSVLMLLMGGVSASWAQNVALSYGMDTQRLVPGETYTICVNMTNDVPVKALMCDIVLPQGMEMVSSEVENGYFELTPRIVRGMDIQANKMSASEYRMLVLPSSSKTVIKAGEGAIAYFNVKVSGQLAPTSTIKMDNIDVTDQNNTNINLGTVAVEVKNSDLVPEITLAINDIAFEKHDVAVPVEVCLFNSKPMSAMQFDLQLPEGVVLDTEEFEYSDRLQQSHVIIITDLGNNTYRVVVNSASNGKFRQTDGVIMTLYMSANLAAEQSEMKVFGQVYSDADGHMFTADNPEFTVGITASSDVVTGIKTVAAPAAAAKYNVAGQQTNAKGLVIVNGKKYIQK